MLAFAVPGDPSRDRKAADEKLTNIPGTVRAFAGIKAGPAAMGGFGRKAAEHQVIGPAAVTEPG
jgi:hypothetical protein